MKDCDLLWAKVKLKVHDDQTEMKLNQELMRVRSLREELEEKDRIIFNWAQSHESLSQTLEEKNFEISTLKEDTCRLTRTSKTLEKESTKLREDKAQLQKLVQDLQKENDTLKRRRQHGLNFN